MDDLQKILISLLLGGLIGAERQFRDKAAGLRTVILICEGSTLFTILSNRLGAQSDPSRVAANVVAGIGFLGAGVILRHRGRIVGLTTASTIWVAAALGMAVGLGQYLLASIATAGVLLVLLCFPRMERLIGRSAELTTYEITSTIDPEFQHRLAQTIASSGLRIISSRQSKREGHMLSTYQILGNHSHHQELWAALLEEDEILEFRML